MCCVRVFHNVLSRFLFYCYNTQYGHVYNSFWKVTKIGNTCIKWFCVTFLETLSSENEHLLGVQAVLRFAALKCTSQCGGCWSIGGSRESLTWVRRAVRQIKHLIQVYCCCISRTGMQDAQPNRDNKAACFHADHTNNRMSSAPVFATFRQAGNGIFYRPTAVGFIISPVDSRRLCTNNTGADRLNADGLSIDNLGCDIINVMTK